MSARWRWWRSSFVHLPFDRLHSTRLLDDIIDELRGLFIPHLSFSNPSLGEQLTQVRVKIVGIPTNVSDMFKPAGCSYVCFGDFGTFFLAFLVLLFFAAQK